MKKENDPGYARRNIPVEFEDYIAKTFGYPTGLLTVPKSMLSRVKANIKERFTQVECKARIAYGRSTCLFYRGDDETPLDFAKRVDNVRYCSDFPVLTGCPFDEPLPPIHGDAETPSLSDLSPELVKQVAAELLELEKTAKYQVHDEYVFEVDDANKRRIEKLINLATNYGMPIFSKSVADADLAMQKWREALDAFYNNPATIARRYAQKLSDAIPKKHAFVRETGPEQIIDRTGKTRIAPADLKIETNQQRSPEELKDWPGNTQQIRKPYRGDPAYADRKVVFSSTTNDGLIWFDEKTAEIDWQSLRDRFLDDTGTRRFWPNSDNRKEFTVKAEIKIRNYAPDNWPPNAPPYFTPEGWEFEKAMKRRQLKSMLTIEWLEKQQTEKHALVAKRLREILAA